MKFHRTTTSVCIQALACSQAAWKPFPNLFIAIGAGLMTMLYCFQCGPQLLLKAMVNQSG